jgi:hypothetical protein
LAGKLVQTAFRALRNAAERSLRFRLDRATRVATDVQIHVGFSRRISARRSVSRLTVAYASSTKLRIGRVVAQHLAPGRRLRNGTLVPIVVGKGCG